MSLDFRLMFTVDTGSPEPYIVELFDANSTHNVVPMWQKAGCYDQLYNSHGKTAGEVVNALAVALATMEANPADYEVLNPSNGWGSYESAVRFLAKVVEACRTHPKAIIDVCA